MFNRRRFIHSSAFGSLGLLLHKVAASNPQSFAVKGKPIVVSTWDAGLQANKAAWNVLSKGGRSLDAVEKGVMVTEDSINCCVGLGGNPDRDGFVTLDSCIMDEF